MAWIIGSVTDAEYEALRVEGWDFGKPEHFKLPERSDAGERIAAIFADVDVSKVMELIRHR